MTDKKIDILIVEDEDYLRDLYSKILKTFRGYSCETVTDGEDALNNLAERFQNRTLPRLVITDCEMPKVNSLDLIRRCKELYPGLPFIIMTGKLEIYKKDFEKEGTPYLGKPCGIENLIKKVEDNISK